MNREFSHWAGKYLGAKPGQCTDFAPIVASKIPGSELVLGYCVNPELVPRNQNKPTGKKTVIAISHAWVETETDIIDPTIFVVSNFTEVNLLYFPAFRYPWDQLTEAERKQAWVFHKRHPVVRYLRKQLKRKFRLITFIERERDKPVFIPRMASLD